MAQKRGGMSEKRYKVEKPVMGGGGG